MLMDDEQDERDNFRTVLAIPHTHTHTQTQTDKSISNTMSINMT